MANPIDTEGLELARKINVKLAELRAADEALQAAITALEAQVDGLGGGGAWGEITGTLSAQTDLQAALDAKLASATAASTYAPISTTVTLAGTQTLSGKTIDETGIYIVDAEVFNPRLITGAIDTLVYAGSRLQRESGDGQFLTNLNGAQILTGNIAVARIATALTTPGPIGGTTPAAISATTVTASGAVTSSTKVQAGYGQANSGYGFIFADNSGIYSPSLSNTYIAYQGSAIAQIKSGGMQVADGKMLLFGGAGSSATAGINNSPAGTLEINNGTAGTLRDVALRHLTASGAITGTEQGSAPAAPAANGFTIYAEDNGSGKTRLMVRFATGASQQIAIEP